MGCFCHFEPGLSFFVIPTCTWENVDSNGDMITTTELATTEFPPTTTPFLTYPEETTLAPVTNGEIDCHDSNLLPNGELVCDGTLCQIYCDPGFAPKQLVDSRALFPATTRSKMEKTTNLDKSKVFTFFFIYDFFL